MECKPYFYLIGWASTLRLNNICNGLVLSKRKKKNYLLSSWASRRDSIHREFCELSWAAVAALVRHIYKFHWCGQWLPGSLLGTTGLRQYFWRQEQCPVQQALDYECWSLLEQGNPGWLSASTPALGTQTHQLLVILSWQSTLLTGSITFPEKSDEIGAIFFFYQG